MDSKQSGLIKIIAGVLLGIAGVFGFIFGKNAKTALLRGTIFVLSGASIFLGSYLFISGATDYAVGKMGTYKLGEEYVQPMEYQTKEAFESGLKSAFTYQQDLRRLKFSCPDKSKSFTVYNTKLGTFGVPAHSITCDDGFQLLSYKS